MQYFNIFNKYLKINVSSENALLSFSQYPEIKRKEFDSKIEDDYYNKTQLLTNLFNYKIDKESGKNIYLYEIDVNEISYFHQKILIILKYFIKIKIPFKF